MSNEGGMQLTIRDLQQRLHEETQRRFETLEKALEKIQETVDAIAARTASVPRIEKDVEGLKASHNRLKGGYKALIAVGGVFEVMWRIVFHKW